MDIQFLWDEEKAQSNLQKHRISFEVAARVFIDPYALTEQDRYENEEYRWQTIGLVDGTLLILVAHTIQDETDGTETIRIISARRADPKERKRYDKANR